MQYQNLGQTGINVSRLCFGALTIGPLQANLPLREGARVIREAFNAGVNFIDTAELYKTYKYIREAMAGFSGEIVISAKSYAYTYEGMKESVAAACDEVGRNYIDIFSLHEQTSRLTLKGHSDALRYLVDAKKAGIIRAIGVSTHTVEVVRAAALHDEIDIIHPIINMKGIGICDGNVDDMLAAIKFAAHDAGKGIYAMKALGGGHLGGIAQKAFQWVLQQPFITSIAVGMQSVDEVALNCAYFNGENVDQGLIERVAVKERKVLIDYWCKGCGSCARACPMHAISIHNSRAVVDRSKCVLCGYCGAHCSEFCIKII